MRTIAAMDRRDESKVITVGPEGRKIVLNLTGLGDERLKKTIATAADDLNAAYVRIQSAGDHITAARAAIERARRLRGAA
jgi:zona occludens toxin (predicted ATPase)